MSHLASRTSTVSTDGGEAVPTSDPSSTLGLLEERLQAWKHACGYLEDYIKAVAKDQGKQSKDSEKILKSLNSPLREGHHFDQAVGGVAGLFENLRVNTQAQGQLYAETESNLTSTVLPIFERLHKEIKAKSKELESGAGKQSKTVDSARNNSQKHIELLGQHSAAFDSSGNRPTAANDPYVLQRGVWYRLNKQLMEENSHRSDIISIQNNFQQFENHVVSTLQSGLNTFNQYMSGQHDRSKAMYGDIAGTAAAIDPNFEWNGFSQRNGHVLISPNAPARDIKSLTFPNQDHRATKPLIEGSLERKSRAAMGSYKSNYYAVTPAGYLHEYKDNDNYRSDPTPEHSLFLPDCVVGASDGQKFAIKGKDTSGNKLAQKLSMSSEYTFKAHTPSDAAQWQSIIASVCAGTSNSLPTSPVSPTNTNQIPSNLNTAAVGQPTQQQMTGTTSPQAMTSPQTATSPQYAQQPGTIPQHAQQSATSPQYAQQPATSPQYAQQPGTVPQHAQQPTMAPQQVQQPGTIPQHAQQPGTVHQYAQQPAAAPVQGQDFVPQQQPQAHSSLPVGGQETGVERSASGAYYGAPRTNDLEPRKY